MKKLLIYSIFTVVLSFASVSQAQHTTINKDDGYEYQFEDDPLNAGGFGPNDSRIRVRRGAQRSTLIRPRTQFIKELIRSVEDL